MSSRKQQYRQQELQYEALPVLTSTPARTADGIVVKADSEKYGCHSKCPDGWTPAGLFCNLPYVSKGVVVAWFDAVSVDELPADAPHDCVVTSGRSGQMWMDCGWQHSGWYRMNHSARWVNIELQKTKGNRIEFRTTRDVRYGEELRYRYDDPDESWSE